MAKKKTIPAASFRPKPQATPKTVSKKIDPLNKKFAWEVIANSLAKSSNGEVLRWRYNEANGELIVLLVDGRKFHSFFDVQD